MSAGCLFLEALRLASAVFDLPGERQRLTPVRRALVEPLLQQKTVTEILEDDRPRIPGVAVLRVA